jgi:mono/diheme cytochrome c family protein
MMDLFVLATTTTEAATQAAEGGGLNENLIQLLFVGLIVAGAGLAALFYASSALANPWRRALSNTDRQALVNAVIITGIALLTGIYTVAEPIRREAAAHEQLETSVHRGVANYAQYCVSCHGIAGTGGPVPKDLAKGQVAIAPPLANRSDFRPASEIEMAQRADFIRKTIERGRPNTAMPAWSVNEGGALNSQEVEDLVAFIQHGNFADVRNNLTPEQIASIQATVTASGGQVEAGAPPGKALYLQKGCAACHAIQGVSSGTVGPALNTQGSNPQIAGVLPNNKENLVKWLLNPPGVKPGTAMPNLGLTPEEADQLADYLQSLK